MGNIFGDIWKGISNGAASAGKAISDGAAAVGRGVSAAYETARNDPTAQIVAAVVTGGTSLAAQAIIENATGEGGKGPITGTFNQLISDPASIATQVPGVLVGGLAIDGIASAVKIGANALGAATGEQFLTDIGNGVNGFQTHLQNDPVDSLKIIGGTVLLATGAGTAPGIALVTDGVAESVAAGVTHAMTLDPTINVKPGEQPAHVSPAPDKQSSGDAAKTQQPQPVPRHGFVNAVVDKFETVFNVDVPGYGHGK